MQKSIVLDVWVGGWVVKSGLGLLTAIKNNNKGLILHLLILQKLYFDCEMFQYQTLEAGKKTEDI